MAYKISGTKSEDARILVVRQDTWEVEANTVISGSGAYEVLGLTEGNKLVLGIADGGASVSYSSVDALLYLSSGDRGVFAGGYLSGNQNIIDYITISTPAGSATNFGDLTVARKDLSGASNGGYSKGVFAGGYSTYNTIDYITITIPGDASDFGDLAAARFDMGSTDNGASNRALWAGGTYTPLCAIEYTTVNTNGNASGFGELSLCRYALAGLSNDTQDRGVFVGGRSAPASYINVIDYVTISTTGNAVNFGDLTLNRYGVAGTSDGANQRGIIAGGVKAGPTDCNIIDYITISSLGDATDFGDLVTDNYYMASCSNKINERGIFAGGWTREDIIQYVTINTLGNATHYNNLSSDRRELTGTSNA